MSTAPLDLGLQRERTNLAWTRTALGAVANGMLVLVRHERAFPLPVSLALAGLSLLAAVVIVLHARLRAPIARQRHEDIRVPRAAVLTVGAVMVALSVGTLAVVVASAV